MTKPYIQHTGKVIETDEKFKLVMALTLDPRTNFQDGIVRCITSRSRSLLVRGNVDRSELHILKGNSLEHFEVGDRLTIEGEQEILGELIGTDDDFIGLEDPDIWIDEETNLMHIYFTIPIIPPTKEEKIKIHLGHAVGKDLHSLKMTMPVLLSNHKFSAKEVSIAPQNTKGFRFNLIESRDMRNGTYYSTIQAVIAHDMNGHWEYGDVLFHPNDQDIPWVAGHVSPGPLFSKNFIDIGEGKLLGVINGREANMKVDGSTKYGTFTVGLFIYDYENGKIDWVSPEPLIEDTEAVTITFASQFVETGSGQGILYAHVDDSFVRAYTLKAEWLRPLFPPEFA